jgi:hypothetical protein
MEQWEYLPTYLKAEAKAKEMKEFLKARFPAVRKPPRYMAESMIPELNDLGRQGWELVHMEPVAGVGSKGDALFEGDGVRWSNVYFCVFKRRKPQPQSQQQPPPAPPTPSAPPPPSSSPPPVTG